MKIVKKADKPNKMLEMINPYQKLSTVHKKVIRKRTPNKNGIIKNPINTKGNGNIPKSEAVSIIKINAKSQMKL